MNNPNHKNWLVEKWDRIHEAGRPLISSISFSTWGGVSAVTAIDYFFKLRKKGVEWGLVSQEFVDVFAPFWVALFAVTGAFAVKALFQISEELVGQRKKEIQLRSRVEAFEQLHAVIHQTRNALLADGSFDQMKKHKRKRREKALYSLIESQLGLVEVALNKFSGKQCVTCLKVLDGDDFRTACYGPTAPLERRKKTTRLPSNLGLAAICRSTKSITAENDVEQATSFFPQEYRSQFAKRYGTVVACPVITNGAVVALLCIDWKEKHIYSKEMDEVLACLTDVISVAFYVTLYCHTDSITTTSPIP